MKVNATLLLICSCVAVAASGHTAPGSAAISPDNEELARRHFMKGRAALEEGKPTTAVHHFLRVKSLRGSLPRRVLPLYARALYASKRYRAAAAAIDAYVASKPDPDLAEYQVLIELRPQLAKQIADETAEVARVAAMTMSELLDYAATPGWVAYPVSVEGTGVVSDDRLGKHRDVTHMRFRDCRGWIRWVTYEVPSNVYSAAAIPLGEIEPPSSEADGVVSFIGEPSPTTAPPRPRPESPGDRAGFVWSKGHYRWRHGQYVWEPGHWERAQPDRMLLDPIWYREPGSTLWRLLESEFRATHRREFMATPPPAPRPEPPPASPNSVRGYWHPDYAGSRIIHSWRKGHSTFAPMVPGTFHQRGRYYDYVYPHYVRPSTRPMPSCNGSYDTDFYKPDWVSWLGGGSAQRLGQNGSGALCKAPDPYPPIELSRIQVVLGGEQPVATAAAISRLREFCYE